jgi:hypothetical protein
MPLVGETFTVEAPGRAPVHMCLSRIERGTRPRPAGPDGASEPSFSLYFVGPEAQPLAQSTYSFIHPAVGRAEIFIVPVGRETAGLLYEAVFN